VKDFRGSFFAFEVLLLAHTDGGVISVSEKLFFVKRPFQAITRPLSFVPRLSSLVAENRFDALKKAS